MSSLTILRQRLYACGVSLPVSDCSINADLGQAVLHLYNSLLYFKSSLQNFEASKIAGIEAIVSCFVDDHSIMPWEYFSISLVLPGLVRRQNQSVSRLALSLELSTSERLAAACMLANIGLLDSSVQCFNAAIKDTDFPEHKLFEVASIMVTCINLSYLTHAGGRSSQAFVQVNSWLELLTRNLSGFSQGQQWLFQMDDIDISSQVKRATLDFQKSIRCIHHVACSGGTVISKCLAAMPNVCLLSEVNPLNRYGLDFNPANPAHLYEKVYGRMSLDSVKEAFINDINQIFRIVAANRQQLILRDHSHTDFFSGAGSFVLGFDPALYACLQDRFELLSVITVRHPLDSYLSLLDNGWHTQFQPSGLEEYCRRYLAFLDYYIAAPLFKYEEFCDNPDAFMRGLCKALYVDYDPSYKDRFGAIQLSGDSGRRCSVDIGPRTRRPIPDSLRSEVVASHAYQILCNRLDYSI